jgi:hypothetical protein
MMIVSDAPSVVVSLTIAIVATFMLPELSITLLENNYRQVSLTIVTYDRQNILIVQATDVSDEERKKSFIILSPECCRFQTLPA